MNKTELTAGIAKKANISQKAAGDALNAAIELITASLKKKEKVALIGFGTFEVKSRKARTGINPATGEKIKIAAAKVPSFKAGKALKDAVNPPKKEAAPKKAAKKK